MSYLGATADLVKVARATLREAVLPQVAADARYESAMVAHALGIVARELELGAAARAEERDLLAAFLDAGSGGGASLAELRARLCRELREEGAWPPEREAELRRLLARRTHALLKISNPDYLDRAF